ncbi:inverse autotransporter beta domain-containing protein [Xenorhabdus miraniensis]|uniref:Putative invasin n=1 Tax=Xenorhabdus miraniensis TaxID=351674 RepID=A0A2D0JSY6_9GAMM|nr:inverse autotransporter beta domain-containing protein [Xenorhabdus miraniensis]PHM49435.1 putative invasin [Xenorhabdus miraniensis]
MPSYARKIILFFIFFYALFMPSAIINAVAENNPQNDKLHTQLAKNDETSEPDMPQIIGSKIHSVNRLLSTSPAELVEQAKSYALGKFNSTVSSEAQKWLSQFGTAKINFGLDKKGKLENHSLDLLLPLYDNKTKWLLFSQLGYRNKDSRNTINFGFGGRYFYQNWMYGLNTFYDYDITGKNRRIGLGSEIWGDYIKLSANAYHRLSNWQKSRNFDYYYERPANGYDINSEFYLPFYPNLGAKLSYEKYFGDSVTLFNRDTKQKNPSLVKLGVTYTPIPLITMGVDYKQGERGFTETQFLANLNYRFGVPLSAQLSGDNVASIRTLAGSRHDLVERNNHIVLDHRKIPVAEISEQNPPIEIEGYSGENIDIFHPFSGSSVKQFHWSIIRDKTEIKEIFEKEGGKISYEEGRVKATLPNLLSGKNENKINTYTGYFFAELSNGKKTAIQPLILTVKPFLIQENDDVPNFKPHDGSLPASGTEGYKFDPVIIFKKFNNPELIKNTTFNKIQWVTEPPADDKNKLKFEPGDKFEQITTDESGHFPEKARVTLTSGEYVGDVKVYLIMDDQPKQLVNNNIRYSVKFKEDKSKYHIKEKKLVVDLSGPIFANGVDNYTYTAIVIDENGAEVKEQEEIDKVKWSAKDKSGSDITEKIQIDGSSKTTSGGRLIAKVSSNEPFTNVVISLSIEGHDAVSADKKVSFVPPDIKVTSSPKSPIFVNETYTLTAEIKDGSIGKPAIKWTIVQGDQQAILTPDSLDSSKATLTSSVAQIVKVKASIDNGATKSAPVEMAFKSPPVDFDIENVVVGIIDSRGNFNPGIPSKALVGDGTSAYAYRATIKNKKTGKAVSNYPFDEKDIQWTRDHSQLTTDQLTGPTIKSYTTTPDGYLYATLTSQVGVDGVKVTLKIPESNSPETKRFISKDADTVSFKPIIQPAVFYLYNTYSGESKVFDNKNGKLHPNTIFATLRGELRDLKYPEQGFNKKDKITYGYAFDPDSFYGAAMLSFGSYRPGDPPNTGTGPIQFQAPGSATITATINKPSGEIQLYEYKMVATKILNPVHGGYVNVSDNNTCPVPPGNSSNMIVDIFSDKEAADPSDIYSLHNEFGNLYNWGVFNDEPTMDKNKVTFIVKNTSSVKGHFRVYDSKNNTFDDYSDGVLLCYSAILKTNK